MFTDILQPTHLLIVLVVALLVLGPKRLPEAGRSLGRSLRDFKDALNTSGEDPPEARPITAAAAPPVTAAAAPPVTAAAAPPVAAAAAAHEPAPHDPAQPAS